MTSMSKRVRGALVAVLAVAASSGCGPEPEPVPEPPPPISCPGDEGGAVTLTIAPFLQSVTATTAWVVWETDTGEGSRVDFGPTEALRDGVCGERVPAVPGADPDVAVTQVHAAQLVGLTPGEPVFYRARTGATQSAVARFRPPSDLPERFAIAAISDSQRDTQNPDVFGDLVRDGVLATAPMDTLAMVLMPGDLVDNGWLLEEWQDEFFGPAAPLLAQVPIYPAIGNHEGGSPLYFRYFVLPEDGLE